MDAGLAVEHAALASHDYIEDIIEQGDSDIQQFYYETTIFITGGTGFIGKQLIEKLLRTCRIKKLYMLIRPKKDKSIYERLHTILEDPIFLNLHRKRPDFVNKLVAIEGDIAELDLGIRNEDRILIAKEIEVIFHVAATIAFEQPIQSATLINVRGTREIIILAKQCTRLKALVYMSTAYCHATSGRTGSKVFEQFYPTPISPELMIKLAEGVEESRLNKVQRGLIDDWPNTYSFTKALAEALIHINAADLPVSIIRPSIVICSRRGSCPGWVDNSSVYGPSAVSVNFGLDSSVIPFRVFESIYKAYNFPLSTLMGIIHVLHTRQDIKIDFVPVDYVCNAAIVSASTARTKPLLIYQIVSSCRNYITWENLTDIINNTVRKTVISDQALWYCFAIQTSNKWIYLVFRCLLQDLPCFIIHGVLVTMGKQPRLTRIYRIFNKISSSFSFYTNNNWIFDDNNILKQYENLSEADKAIYYHDIKDVNWTEMILIWYVGLRKYIVKDGLKNTNIGIKRQLYFKIATYIISGVFIYLFMSIMYLIFC